VNRVIFLIHQLMYNYFANNSHPELKRKSRQVPRFPRSQVNLTLRSFYKCTDAPCTKNFPNLLPVFIDGDFLQVWMKSSQGSFLRPRSVTSKGCFLPAIFTLCHLVLPFQYHNYLHLVPKTPRNPSRPKSRIKPDNLTTNRILLQDKLLN
jgi:hypothetical protein